MSLCLSGFLSLVLSIARLRVCIYKPPHASTYFSIHMSLDNTALIVFHLHEWFWQEFFFLLSVLSVCPLRDDATTHVFLSDSFSIQLINTCLRVSLSPTVFFASEAAKTTWPNVHIRPLNSAGFWSLPSWFHAWQRLKRNRLRAVQWWTRPATMTRISVPGNNADPTIWRSCDTFFWHLMLLNGQANEKSRNSWKENWFVMLPSAKERASDWCRSSSPRSANISVPSTIQAQHDSKRSKVSVQFSSLSVILIIGCSLPANICSLLWFIDRHPLLEFTLACFFASSLTHLLLALFIIFRTLHLLSDRRRSAWNFVPSSPSPSGCWQMITFALSKLCTDLITLYLSTINCTD